MNFIYLLLMFVIAYVFLNIVEDLRILNAHIKTFIVVIIIISINVIIIIIIIIIIAIITIIRNRVKMSS